MPAMAREHFTFCHTLRVRWAEVDKQGIVYNVNYFLYFDVGITEYWRAIGINYPDGIVKAFGTEGLDDTVGIIDADGAPVFGDANVEVKKIIYVVNDTLLVDFGPAHAQR